MECKHFVQIGFNAGTQEWSRIELKMSPSHTEMRVFSNTARQLPRLGLIALIGLTGLFSAPVVAVAQSHSYEQLALSSATRAGLGRAGGGKVLSVERIQSGMNGLSRVKILDTGGRIQVYVIEDSPRLSRNTPFEREESGRVSQGRFFRGEPLPAREHGQGKPRSGDVRGRD